MSNVDHPSHYNIPGKRECIESMKEDYGPFVTACFCLGNSYKYLYRAGNKDGNPEEQDIDKAKWYKEYADGLLKGDVISFKDILYSIRRLYNDVKKEIPDG